MILRNKTAVALGLVFLFGACALGIKRADRRSLSSEVDEELPWEIKSDLGESVLPDLFYAEDVQNEQVMPLTDEYIAGKGRYFIDRMIYPTLGNPKLFVKTRPDDNVMVILRVEEDLFTHLKPKLGSKLPGKSCISLEIEPDENNGFYFFLIPHEKRSYFTTQFGGHLAATAENGAVTIHPSSICIYPELEGMPEVFKKRKTLRFTFDKEALNSVSSGLYDIRYEILKSGNVIDVPSPRPKIEENAYEWQYNALRVFDKGPEADGGQYSFISLSDTQLAMGTYTQTITIEKLKQFVNWIDATPDPKIRNAAFILFSGDLHNGGSWAETLANSTAMEYNLEARTAIRLLSELTFPIFLIPGNHDSYVSSGHVPFFTSLFKGIRDADPKAWPNYKESNFKDYLNKTTSVAGGKHLDLFEGRYMRRDHAKTWKEAWLQIPDSERNYILYDGFNQWRRTYGPLYFSWAYGKNYFIGINSSDLRQHWRSGWGLFTMNYGGSLSPVQYEWLEKEIYKTSSLDFDVVLSAHHDPRGGHRGKDYPYYFSLVDYTDILPSAWNFVKGNYLNPNFCGVLPSWVHIDDNVLGCLHDGLQEWMQPDREYDCVSGEHKSDGTCKHPWYSGYSLIDLLTKSPQVRTLILGHTHSYSLSVFQEKDEFMPSNTPLSTEQCENLEANNPIRAEAALKASSNAPSKKMITTSPNDFKACVEDLKSDLTELAPKFHRTIEGDKRDLAVIRVVANADITSQRYQTDADNYGFTVFSVYPKSDERNYLLPQINRQYCYLNLTSQLSNGPYFKQTCNIEINRAKHLDASSPDNPVIQTFSFSRKY